MRRASTVAAGAAAFLACGLVVAPAALAQSVERYSGGVSNERIEVLDSSLQRGPAGDAAVTSARVTRSSVATLPFTGSELVLIAASGAGVLAAGTALVVAGRRRPGVTA
jgi:hypothetical protein